VTAIVWKPRELPTHGQMTLPRRYFLAPEHFRTPSYISCGSLYGERGGELVSDAAIAGLRELAERRAPRPVKPGR